MKIISFFTRIFKSKNNTIHPKVLEYYNSTEWLKVKISKKLIKIFYKLPVKKDQQVEVLFCLEAYNKLKYRLLVEYPHLPKILAEEQKKLREDRSHNLKMILNFQYSKFMYYYHKYR